MRGVGVDAEGGATWPLQLLHGHHDDPRPSVSSSFAAPDGRQKDTLRNVGGHARVRRHVS